MILRSFIEVEVFFEFSIRSIMGVATLIYALAGLIALRRPSDAALQSRLSRGVLSHVALPARPRSFPHPDV